MKKLAASSLVLFLAACGVNDDATPMSNTPPTVTLAASPGGAAPLTVTLNATASDSDGDALSYAWSLPGLPDAATVQTTFAIPGDYPVSVTVSDGEDSASASVTVRVTGDVAVPAPPGEPENPVSPPTDPGDNPAPPAQPTIKLTASPSGPVPWAVRYDITATGYPQGSTYSPTCLNGSSEFYATELDDDSFVCFHTAVGERVEVAVFPPVPDSGNGVGAVDEKTFAVNVKPSSGVPFKGTWRYSDERTGQTGTFTVSQAAPTGTGGSDATGTHSLSYAVQDAEATLTFVWPNGSAQVVPRPLENGTQVFLSPDSASPDGEGDLRVEKIN